MNNLSENRITIGRHGENIAKEYLQKKGYKIIECNWRTRRGEIDLIALNKQRLCFIEVRTRRGEQFGLPEDSINRRKRNKMMKNAQVYILLNNSKRDYCLECVCIVLDNDSRPLRINHYENVQ